MALILYGTKQKKVISFDNFPNSVRERKILLELEANEKLIAK